MWNQGWDLVCDASQVSMVSSSIGGWDLQMVDWDLVAFEECGERETDLVVGCLHNVTTGLPASFLFES